MSLRIRYNAPVVLSFSLLCAVVYFINSAHADFETAENGPLSFLVLLKPHFSFSNPLDYLNLFLYILGHSNIQHLLGNLSFILLIGPIMEERYGSRNLLLMIFLTAIITGILNILLFDSALWGASGIVFMFIILVSFTNMHQRGIPLTFILILLLYVGNEIIKSFDDNNISEFAHIAGGIIGSIFGFSKRMRHDIKDE